MYIELASKLKKFMTILKKALQNLFALSFMFFLLGFSSPSFAQQPNETQLKATFSDIEVGGYFYPIAEFLFDRGIFTGYPDGSFGRDHEIKRAELMVVVVRMIGINPTLEDYDHCFPDVTSDNPDNIWFVPSVCYAAAQGWVNGYQNGNFGPADFTTVPQSLKIVLNPFFAEEIRAQDDFEAYQNKITWYEPYFWFAEEKNLIPESILPVQWYKSQVGPQHATRGNVAELISRTLPTGENNWENYHDYLMDDLLLQNNKPQLLSRGYPCYESSYNDPLPDFMRPYVYGDDFDEEVLDKDLKFIVNGYCLMQGGDLLLILSEMNGDKTDYRRLVTFDRNGNIIDESSTACEAWMNELRDTRSYSDYSVNPNGFEFIDCLYAKSIDGVYFNGKKIEEADLSTFEPLTYPYSKDADNAFLFGKAMEGVDVNSFSPLLPENAWLPAAAYAKDDEYIYFLDTPMDGVDPETFEVLGAPSWPDNWFKDDGKVVNSFYYFLAHYAKDKNHWYASGNVFEVSDLDSFEILDFFYAKDKDSVYTLIDSEELQSDWPYLYYGGVVAGADPTSFESLNSVFGLDGTDLYYRGVKIEGSNVHTATVLQRNGGEIYDAWLKTDQGIYFNDQLIPQVTDPEAFEFIGDRHAKDSMNVFYVLGDDLMAIEGADSESFELVEGFDHFSKDKTSLFYENKRIESVDPNTVEIVTESSYLYDYLKDSNHVYLMEKSPLEIFTLEDADSASFEVLMNPHTYQAFSKTSSFVYYYGNKLEGIHAPSFEVIDGEYSKDQTYVYFLDENENYVEHRALTNGDPDTFEVLTEAHHPANFARDANQVYYLGDVVVVENIDAASIQVLNYGKLKDDHAVYCKPDANHPWWIMDDADPDTFVVYSGGQYSWDHDSYYSYCHRIDELPDHIKKEAGIQ